MNHSSFSFELASKHELVLTVFENQTVLIILSVADLFDSEIVPGSIRRKKWIFPIRLLKILKANLALASVELKHNF